MEKLLIDGNTIVNLPGFANGAAQIVECETPSQFATWCEGGESMACRHDGRVYIKTPRSLSEHGEFSLDFDCLPLEEANKRIEEWNSGRRS